jgi:hypothetical protein
MTREIKAPVVEAEKSVSFDGQHVYCSKCRLQKEPQEFYKNKGTPSGFTRYCRLCTSVLNRSPKYKAARLAYSQSAKRKASVKAYLNSDSYKARKERGDFAKNQRKLARTITGRFRYAQDVADRRGLPFLLERTAYARLIEKPCYYCGVFTFGAESGGGLDRIDNTQGYTLDNILPCCATCNKARGNWWTVEETKAAIHAVLELRGQYVQRN